MITQSGYSKDPSIIPEGIVITWGKDMLKEKGIRPFIRHFEEWMKHEDALWMQWCKNAPKNDILYVYIIVLSRLKYRCFYAGHEIGETEMGNADGSTTAISNPRILMAGPFEHCPFKRKLKGFQGFRYCTKLF